MKLELEHSGVAFTPYVRQAWNDCLEATMQLLMDAEVLTSRAQVGKNYGVFNANTGVMTISAEIAECVVSLDVYPGAWCFGN